MLTDSLRRKLAAVYAAMGARKQAGTLNASEYYALLGSASEVIADVPDTDPEKAQAMIRFADFADDTWGSPDFDANATMPPDIADLIAQNRQPDMPPEDGGYTTQADGTVFEKKISEPKDPAEVPDVPIPQLTPHDMDIPEEPELVNLTTRVWDVETQSYITKNLGPQWLVPTGCKRPHRVSPYETTVVFRSALPRDRAADANLYALYQKSGWRSRHWIMTKGIDEHDINLDEMDKEIADDIPFTLALQGLPDPAGGVAQTAGVQEGAGAPGSNNGAPLPPGPGPGRGNKVKPGDNLASKPAAPGGKPPNPAPGTGV